MDKKIPKQVVGIGVGVIILFVVVLIIVSSIKNKGFMTDIKDDEQATKVMDKLMKDIDVKKGNPYKASVTLESDLAQELPDIDQYPLSVEGKGDVVIEIFATSEKSGKDKDGWINDIAKKFNKEGYTTSDGQTMSVSIRPMASGMGSDYIISEKYLPQGYTPSNYLYGALIEANGGNVSVATEKLVGNVAGILVSESTYDKIEKKYDKVEIGTVVEATSNNDITMGYTNPLSSATGLNFLVSTLSYYDSDDISSDQAKEGFTSFQQNVPYVAYTTLQMRTSAKSGSFDGMVMEYQSYINDDDLTDEYKFVPFGIRHDNPLYSVGNLSSEEQEAMDKFVEYCESDEAQKLASKYGFNKNDSYSGNSEKYTGSDLISAQKLWKKNKDSGKDIVAVFVADVSGSMNGEPLNALKTSLTNGAQYINDNNKVGLVSYSTYVTVELEIDKFDLNQRAYFQGAVESLSANGNTASYDALVVALDMLLKERENNPDAKPMLFLLSDGAANIGNSINDIKGIFQYYQIPIYTISYGEDADTQAMQEVSQINEAASINASSEDVVYKMKSLFSAQM